MPRGFRERISRGNAIDRRRHSPEGAQTRDCLFCVSSVPVAARRCAFCTSELPAAEGAP